ncbi:Hydroxypyruvate isomerase [Stieleria neptunia]|uniref:Hydroxypyruvate isomerase n=1 Tax=Stieleria neptunia TaxID=2527979 RepID=A0A518HJZ9_9BACT|nr:TIM barrel protein [Stieleria neptunia]QDV41187.1 Hydroxypyruvate isomerase [Stieleria neptunia]
MKRRDFVAANLIAAAGAALAPGHLIGDDDAASGGRIRQSIMGWCFNPMDMLKLAVECKRIGLEAMEGINAKLYDQVTAMGLKISLVGSHGFATGPLDRDNHAEVEKKLRDGIDLAVQYGAPNVITFTGMRKQGISDAAARKNCLDCWKRVIPYAEEKGIGLVLEHLNSKAHLNPDGTVHPMKGHPGYWGDDIHQCAELVNQVGSERFKLLYDIYHVQIMNGDLIANLEKYQSIIGHYHTAGNPGRRELDGRNEINYPAVMRAIKATGYRGYVAQEFIPTSDDPIRSLEEAYAVCDV